MNLADVDLWLAWLESFFFSFSKWGCEPSFPISSIGSFVAYSGPTCWSLKAPHLCVLTAHTLAFPWSRSSIVGCCGPPTLLCWPQQVSSCHDLHLPSHAWNIHKHVGWSFLTVAEKTLALIWEEKTGTLFFFFNLDVGSKGAVLPLVASQESDSCGKVHRQREKVWTYAALSLLLLMALYSSVVGTFHTSHLGVFHYAIAQVTKLM